MKYQPKRPSLAAALDLVLNRIPRCLGCQQPLTTQRIYPMRQAPFEARLTWHTVCWYMRQLTQRQSDGE